MLHLNLRFRRRQEPTKLTKPVQTGWGLSRTGEKTTGTQGEREREEKQKDGGSLSLTRQKNCPLRKRNETGFCMPIHPAGNVLATFCMIGPYADVMATRPWVLVFDEHTFYFSLVPLCPKESIMYYQAAPCATTLPLMLRMYPRKFGNLRPLWAANLNPPRHLIILKPS